MKDFFSLRLKTLGKRGNYPRIWETFVQFFIISTLLVFLERYFPWTSTRIKAQYFSSQSAYRRFTPKTLASELEWLVAPLSERKGQMHAMPRYVFSQGRRHWPTG